MLSTCVYRRSLHDNGRLNLRSDPVTDLVHVRGELPWLRSGPLFRVHVDARPILHDLLDEKGFRVLELEGAAITSRQTAHEELALVFGFPDYYGKNWDAFNDVMGDYALDHDGERVAVVWRDVAASAQQAPATTAEVGWALIDMAFRLMPRIDSDDPWDQLSIFATGTGDDFDRP